MQKHLILLGLVAAFLPATLSAQTYTPVFQSTSNLGSSVVTDTWTNLTSTNHPGYPGISGDQTWPAPIAPDATSARQSAFRKTPGFESDDTDFLDPSLGGGIYSFFSNTHFEISSALPVANANTLQLQISMAEGATGQDLIAPPVLTIQGSGGTFTLTPNTSALLGQTAATIFGMSTNIDLLGYTWNIPSSVGTISNVTVDWQVDMHSITEGAQLAQAATPVPEPRSAIFLSTAFGGLLAMRSLRRRRVRWS